MRALLYRVTYKKFWVFFDFEMKKKRESWDLLICFAILFVLANISANEINVICIQVMMCI